MTFRAIIAFEGRVTNNGGWHLLDKSLTFPEDRVPVYMGMVGKWEDMIGHADEFERNELGEVSAQIKLKRPETFGNLIEHNKFQDFFDVSIYGDQLETKSRWTARPMVVDRVRIRAIVVWPIPGIPRGLIPDYLKEKKE